MRDRELDQELSALIDGELPPARAREVREEVEADPALSERLAGFESVGELLQSLPRPELPNDLRARLQERIDQVESSPSPSPASLEPRRPGPSRWRFGAPLVAALASGLMAVWLGRPQPETEVERSDFTLSDANDRDLAASDSLDAGPAIENASDEELAIAFELETLRELDVIWELDLLEALLAMENAAGWNGSEDAGSTLEGLDTPDGKAALAPIEERG